MFTVTWLLDFPLSAVLHRDYEVMEHDLCFCFGTNLGWRLFC
jgi:hypothetical protein